MAGSFKLSQACSGSLRLSQALELSTSSLRTLKRELLHFDTSGSCRGQKVQSQFKYPIYKYTFKLYF